MILCADHELNVSAVTARRVALAGSTPYAVIIAGLAALQGHRHGGRTAGVGSGFSGAAQDSVPGALVDYLRCGDPLPGFGHLLYPDRDPRDRLPLAMVEERCPMSPTVNLAAEYARRPSRHWAATQYRLCAGGYGAGVGAACPCCPGALCPRPQGRWIISPMPGALDFSYSSSLNVTSSTYAPVLPWSLSGQHRPATIQYKPGPVSITSLSTESLMTPLSMSSCSGDESEIQRRRALNRGPGCCCRSPIV